MKSTLILFLLFPVVFFAQTKDFHQFSGDYVARSGAKFTMTYSDQDWSGEPESKITFTANDFFHRFLFSDSDSQKLGGLPVFLMEGMYYLVEIEPGVLAHVYATPTWSLNGSDRIADVYAKKKELLSKWTDEAVNQQLVKLSK